MANMTSTVPEFITTSSPTSGANTPTTTIIGDPETLDDVPWPGSKFIIRSVQGHRILTVRYGALVVEDHLRSAGGWQWACEEKKGWLAFRNVVSGDYLGHDGKGNFHALWPHHKGWENFCVRKHPEGGYVLLTLHGEVFWKMTIIGDGVMETGVVETRWEFVKV